MVKDFKLHEQGGKKTFWSFRVVLSAWDLPCESTGWKYFPDTETIKPPCYRAGTNWLPSICEVNGDFLKRLVIAVKRALGEDASNETAATTGPSLVLTDPEEIKAIGYFRESKTRREGKA